MLMAVAEDLLEVTMFSAEESVKEGIYTVNNIIIVKDNKDCIKHH